MFPFSERIIAHFHVLALSTHLPSTQILQMEHFLYEKTKEPKTEETAESGCL
jgi:hypothetical protein